MEGVTLGPGTLGGAGIGRICGYGNDSTKSSATVGFVTGSNPAPSDGALNLAALLVLG